MLRPRIIMFTSTQVNLITKICVLFWTVFVGLHLASLKQRIKTCQES